MKKVMKTFTFGSKGFMRILLLCMIACFSLTQARADYYYRVKLADNNGNIHQIGGNDWSAWIHVNLGSGIINALNKLIGGEIQEQDKENDGRLKFTYNDGNAISLTVAERDALPKNKKGNPMYTVDGKEYELQPVMKKVKRLGTTIHDEKGNAIDLEYTDGNGKEMTDNDLNYYKKYNHNYKIVGLAIGRGSDGGSILQFSDWYAFGRMKDDLKELDLAAWNKEKVNGSYYMSNMSNLEKLILPDHNFAIGGDYMFAGANKLKIIQYGNYGANNDAENLTINTDANKCKVTCIGHAAFENCYDLPGSYIKEMVNSAAAYAKTNNNDPGLEYNKIGDNAFYHCYAFTDDFAIPDGIKYIGKQAFENGNITNLTCGYELKKIDDRAFKMNYPLQTVDLSNINEIGIEAFDMKNDGNNNNKPLLSEVSLGGNDIRIYSKAFRRCCYMTDFKLKNGAQIKQLNDGVFLDCRLITSLAVQTIINNYAANSDQKYNGEEGAKFIPANLFFGANGKPDYGTEEEKNTVHKNLTTITIPSEFVVIGKGAFGVTDGETSNINSITVSKGVAPQCDVLDGTNSDVKGKKAFGGVDSNHVTVYFNGDAAGYTADGSTGYKTYRKEAEFMRLLTKTLDEDKETYDVYPQMYADVKLTRSFKKGWNTLALPFGSPANGNKIVDCAEVYTKALGCSDIAVYRGLRVNRQDASKSVFTFLHYGNVQVDPLDEFEPILVKMPATVTKEYTFENVDLNYDKDNDKLYTAAQILERGCKNSKDGHFDGKYNDGDPVNFPLFNGNNYTTFYFDGTFKMIKDESNSIFKEGDYIIQDGKFIMCKTGKKYGMKAFRGYFKKFDSAPLGAREAINIAVFDGDGTVTDIVRVDANGEAEANAPHDIYNIMGQKVRSNALSTEGLKSGIYIINGKKVLVK